MSFGEISQLFTNQFSEKFSKKLFCFIASTKDCMHANAQHTFKRKSRNNPLLRRKRWAPTFAFWNWVLSVVVYSV